MTISVSAFVRWAIVASFVTLSYPSLLDQYKSQPWPLKIDQFTSCCEYLPKTMSLNATKDLHLLQSYSNNVDTCVNQLLVDGFCRKDTDFYDKQVLIMSLATEGKGKHKVNDITLFRPFQIGVVGAYAEHHQYKFCSHTTIQPSDVDEEDFRWHKVRLMYEALDSYAKNVEYLVWIGKKLLFCNLFSS